MTLVLKLFRITFLSFGGVDSSFARKRSASGCKILASSSGTPYASTACSRAYTLVAGPDSLTVAAGDAWRVITPFNAAEAPYPCTALWTACIRDGIDGESGLLWQRWSQGALH